MGELLALTSVPMTDKSRNESWQKGELNGFDLKANVFKWPFFAQGTFLSFCVLHAFFFLPLFHVNE